MVREVSGDSVQQEIWKGRVMTKYDEMRVRSFVKKALQLGYSEQQIKDFMLQVMEREEMPFEMYLRSYAKSVQFDDLDRFGDTGDINLMRI